MMDCFFYFVVLYLVRVGDCTHRGMVGSGSLE